MKAAPVTEAEPRNGTSALVVLASTAVLTALWYLVLTSMTALMEPGPWLHSAFAVAATTTIVTGLLKTLSWYTAAALGGAMAGLGVVVYRAGTWLTDPASLFAMARVDIIEGVAPMVASQPLEALLLVFTFLASVIVALIFVGAPAIAGIATSLLLLVPYAVTGVSVGGETLLLAGLALVVLVWLGASRLNLAGLVGAAAALGIAAAVVAVAPIPRDRVWNESLMLGPVSGSGVDVTIALAEDLRQPSPTVAFTYTNTAGGPKRFKLATLAEFSSTGRWYPQEEAAKGDLDVETRRSAVEQPPSPVPEQLQAVVEVEIVGLVSSWLPLPDSSSQQVTGGGGGFNPQEWIWREESNTAHSDVAVTRGGNRYMALAEPVQPTGEVAQGGAEQYLELPEDVPQAIRAAAQEVTQGSEDPLQAASALEGWFRSGDFTYDESAPYSPGTDNPFSVMEAFLETRSGFCVHFASTFAVMARSVGIPTRVAVGYVSGSEPGSQTSVRNNELHAWPEIYQDGFGWVAFEPTPGGAGVRAETGDDVPVEPEVEEEAPETPDAANPQREEIPEEDVTADDAANPVESSEGVVEGESLAGLVWLLVALIALVVLTPATTRWIKRVHRLRGVSAQMAWAEFEDTAIDLGLMGALRAQTTDALVEDLGERGILSAGSAQYLADAANAERYGTPASPIPSSALQSALDACVAELRAHASRSQRFLAVFWPRSLWDRPTPTRRS